MGFGPSAHRTIDSVVELSNTATKYGRFEIDPLEHLRALERARVRNWTDRLFYHSHPDVPAYLSPDDRAGLMFEGRPLLCDVIQIVVSVYGGSAREMVPYRWDETARDFVRG